jgi:hypothetical protein
MDFKLFVANDDDGFDHGPERTKSRSLAQNDSNIFQLNLSQREREREKRKAESDPSPRAIRHLSFLPLTRPHLVFERPRFPLCSTRSLLMQIPTQQTLKLHGSVEENMPRVLEILFGQQMGPMSRKSVGD